MVAEGKVGESLTWPEGLSVSESDKAAVVNFSLRGGTKTLWTTEKIVNADSSKGFAQQHPAGYLTAVASGQQQRPLFCSQDESFVKSLFFWR